MLKETIMEIERILGKYGDPPKEGMPLHEAWNGFLKCITEMDRRLENYKVLDRTDLDGKEL